MFERVFSIVLIKATLGFVRKALSMGLRLERLED